VAAGVAWPMPDIVPKALTLRHVVTPRPVRMLLWCGAMSGAVVCAMWEGKPELVFTGR